MRQQRRRRRPAVDPVADWDGIALITLPNGVTIEAEAYKKVGPLITMPLKDRLRKQARDEIAEGGDAVLAQYYPQLRISSCASTD